ncbi:PAS domain S-box protein [Desulfospira joergensenii]|uniref:PAS domain S-box protein n=1 Tax=Desulfospira joergensenii TaxID=53329 RepID=UPI0003B3F0F8|nr:PAS domain S-box protein [Desulfospira joergensenii]
MTENPSSKELKKQIRELQNEIKRLKEEKEIYAEIFSLSPDQICVADIHTFKFLKVNPAFSSFLGHPEEDLVGRSFMDFIHPGDIEPTIAVVNEKLKLGEKVLNFTNRYRCSDGTYHWLEWISQPMPERGITFASAHDITLRKNIEISLRENQAFIGAIMDNLPIGIAVNSVGPTVKFEYINDNFPKFYRTTREALADPDGFWSSVYEDPVFREKIKNRIIKDCATGDPSQMVWEDIPITRKGKETVYVTARNTPIPEKGLMISTVWDVTQRKKTEEALKESEERLDLALSGANEGIWDWYLEENRLHFDSRYYRMAGYEPNEFPAAIEEWEKRLHPEDLEKTLVSVKQYLSGEKEDFDVEFRFQRKGGDYMWIRGKGKIVARNEEGTPIRFTGTHSDITEHKQMEQGLRESEERYRTLHNASFGGLFIHDNGVMLDCNQGLSMISGYTRDELMGMDAFNLIASDWRETVRQKIMAGFEQPYEVEGIRKDGTRYPLYIHGKNLTYMGRVVRAVEYRDITEKKMAEQALQQNYVQLMAIYNTLPVIIWSLDENGIFTLSEGRELKTLGLKSGELVGLSALYLYKDKPLIMEKIKKALKGQSCEYESEASGAIYHSFLTPFYNEDNRVGGVNGIAINVTEKKRVEAELRSLRNYFANIIDSMPSVLIGVDKEGRVTQWNRKAKQITGVSPESAKGQPLEKAFPVLSNELERVKRAIHKRQVCSDPRLVRKEENQTRYEDVTIYPLVANGVEGAVIRVDDVTEQVRLEEMMVQSEKMLSVGGLAAGMAHEINNPLAGMIQTANVMKSRLGDLDMPANRSAAEAIGISMDQIRTFMEKRNILNMVETINESGQRVAEIVNNMLSFARKTDANVSSHRPDRLLDQILEIASTDYDLKKQYDFKTIKIIKEYEENLPMIPCEGAKIQQVLLNLLRNGAQAMQMKHAAKKDPPCFILRVSVEKESRMLRMEIEDNGPGMDEATRKRVFEPFFTTKPVGIGTGLGLSVSYFIIKQNHGGDLKVESRPGSGTKFIIRLPMEGKKEERTGL